MVASKTHENLNRITKNVETSYSYFLENYQRYREFRKFVFKESVSQQQKSMLQQLSRPVVEFNILEAYISRLLGEFAKQEPSIEVSPAEGNPVNQEVIDVVEGHIRHILHQANKDSFSYEIYKDILSGGFSAAKIWTDYSSPMSFNQQIYLSRVFDPTLVGFDPMARTSHKGDGHYCFEIYPMTEDDFKKEYPKAKINKVNFTRTFEGFNWSYQDINGNKIVLVCDYYEKKKKKTKIVRLADGRTLTVRDYERMQAYWIENQFIEQLPVIVGEPRWTELETICRYRLIENEILDYVETDYTYLPIIFVDGHSINLTKGTANETYQMTRPYVFHAKGIQDMVNFSGQSLCNSMENLIQHKFIVMKEAIPQEQDYIEALNDIQRANTVVVNAFYENNPDQPINNPIREVQNIPLPPEVFQSFQTAGAVTQTILGSYASNLGKNDNDLSGKAVIESSTVGNAAAMPYVVGYLQALTQIGNIIADLMPKYLVGPRVIPLALKNEEKKYQGINKPGMPFIDYERRALKVNIEAGVNFQVQKNQAVQQIISLTQANETLGQFFTSEKGLKILCKNLTIYGADNLEEAVDEFMQQQQQMQKQQQQMQQQMMQQDPRMIKAQSDMQKIEIDKQELQMKEKQQQFDNMIKLEEVAIEKELAESSILESEAKIHQGEIESQVKIQEIETSLAVHELEAESKMAEIESRRHHDDLATHELAHKISIENKGRNGDFNEREDS